MKFLDRTTGETVRLECDGCKAKTEVKRLKNEPVAKAAARNGWLVKTDEPDFCPECAMNTGLLKG